MPALSPTMTSGNIGSWQKQVGDEVTPGDVLVEIETDKAQMDFECQDEGFVAKIFIDSGSKDIAVNQAIAVLAENKEDVDKFADFQPESSGSSEKVAESTESAAPPASSPEPQAEAPKSESSSSAPAPTPSSGDRVIASPLAKSIARDNKVDLSAVKGTGPNGRIVKDDVDQYIKSGAASKATTTAAAPAAPQATPTPAVAPTAVGAYTDIPASNMRRVIANRLTESKQQRPHYYLTVEVNMEKISKLRKALNEAANGEYKLSVNDFIVKAAALTLLKVPEVNSAWHTEFIRQYHSADISIATATPNGLITPIVRSAEAKGLSTISNTIKELAGRARSNGLKPQEYQGGSFTISNLGMFGIDSFTAIINDPQSCILAIGNAEQRVVPDAQAEAGFRVAPIMKATLSCDHRVVDGAVGAQWLKAWKEVMENPLKMLL